MTLPACLSRLMIAAAFAGSMSGALHAQIVTRVAARNYVIPDLPALAPGAEAPVPYQADSIRLHTKLVAQGITGDALTNAMRDATAIFKAVRDADEKLGGIFKTAGGGAANDRAYVTTEVFSGSLARDVFFSISVAQAVANKDTAVAAVTNKEFQQRLADALSIVQHGGGLNVSIRGQRASDPNKDWFRAGAFKAGGGTIGLTSSSNSRFVAGGDLEGAISKKVYDAEQMAGGIKKVTAELYGIVRAGFHYGFDGLLVGNPGKSGMYYQGSFQVRVGSKTMLGISVTGAGRTLKDYVQPVHFYTSLGL